MRSRDRPSTSHAISHLSAPKKTQSPSSILSFDRNACFSASEKNFTMGDFHSPFSILIKASPFAPYSFAISVSSSAWPIVIPAKPFALIDQLHSKTAVRFIAAVSANCLAISKAIKGRFDVDVVRFFENCREHSFSNLENVIGRCERRFNIYLGKLRLPVGSQVFVTKTFGNLKILLHAGYHEQLFILLRCLR